MPTLKIQKADGTFEFLQLAGEEFADIGNQVLDVKSQLAQKAKKNEVVNIIDISKFGAVGDGVTDDTNAIIDALQQCQQGKQNIIYFPKKHVFSGVRIGNMDKTNTKNVPTLPKVDNLVFTGHKGLSEIILKDESNVDMFVFRQVNNITFENLILNGNRDKQTGIGGWGAYWDDLLCGVLARAGKNFKMVGCEVINHKWGGINISAAFEYVDIKNNHFTDSINGVNVSVNYGHIVDNHVRRCTGVGIYVEGNDVDEAYGTTNADVIVRGNIVHECHRGIHAQKMVFNCIVKENMIVKGTHTGIHVNGTGLTQPRRINQIIVDSNVIREITGTGHGINIGGVEKISVNNNHIEKCVVGIRLYQMHNTQIKGNDVSLCGDHGIALLGTQSLGCNNNIVTKNRCYNNCKDGTNLGSGIFVNGNRNTVEGNYLYDDQTTKTQKYGLYMDRATNLLVLNNVIFDNILRTLVNGGNSTYYLKDNILVGETVAITSTASIVTNL